MGIWLEQMNFNLDFSNLAAPCSWMVFETIDYYLINGIQIYGCLIDCTKAFDTVEHNKLFRNMVDAKVPQIADMNIPQSNSKS